MDPGHLDGGGLVDDVVLVAADLDDLPAQLGAARQRRDRVLDELPGGRLAAVGQGFFLPVRVHRPHDGAGDLGEGPAARGPGQGVAFPGGELLVEASQPAGQDLGLAQGDRLRAGPVQQLRQRDLPFGGGGQGLRVDQRGVGDADRVHQDEAVLADRLVRVGGDLLELGRVDGAGAASLHLLEQHRAAHVTQEDDALQGLDVRPGGDHVDGDGDPQAGGGAQGADQLVRVLPGLPALVGDLLGEVVAASEDLLDLGEDVLGVVLTDREDQSLGELAPVRREPAPPAVPVGGEHRADLVDGDHRPADLAGGVGEVVVELLIALPAGLPVPDPHGGARLDRGDALLPQVGVYAHDVEVDVHPVGDRLLVGVLRHQVTVEEAKGLLGRGGGQARQMGVEVVQDAAPQAVDGAVALIHDDHVERLDRDGRVVGDLGGLVQRVRLVTGPAGPVGPVGLVRVVGLDVGELLAAQQCVHPLDRADDHRGGVLQPRRAEAVDVVEVGEAAAVVRGGEPAELVVGLAAQVGAVDEEQDPACPGVPQQPVGGRHGGVGLAGAGGHLDQRPRPVVPQRTFQAVDRVDLCRAQPVRFQLGELAQGGPPGRGVRVLAGAPHPGRDGLGPVEGEDRPGAGVRVQPVEEVALGAGGGVAEGERFGLPPDGVAVPLEDAGRVPVVLLDGAGEMVALTLRLDHADDPAVDVEDVVGAAGGQRELADRHSLTGRGIDLVAVLNEPAGLAQHPVDGGPGLRLVERRRALGALDDDLALPDVDLTGLLAGGLIAGVLGVAEPLEPGGELFDGVEELPAVRVGAGDQPFGLGAGPPLGVQRAGGFGEPRTGLGQCLPMAGEGLAQLGQLGRVCDRGTVARVGGWDELGDRPAAGDRVVEPDAQLVADPHGDQGAGAVEEVLVGGPVPVPAQPVEVGADPGAEHTGLRQRREPVDLPGAVEPDTDPGDHLFGQHLAELAGLDQRRVRVGEHRRLGEGAVDGQQRLERIQRPEVRRPLRGPTEPLVDQHHPRPRPRPRPPASP